MLFEFIRFDDDWFICLLVVLINLSLPFLCFPFVDLPLKVNVTLPVEGSKGKGEIRTELFADNGNNKY